VAKLAIRTIDCGIVAMAALGYGGPWLWRAVTLHSMVRLASLVKVAECVRWSVFFSLLLCLATPFVQSMSLLPHSWCDHRGCGLGRDVSVSRRTNVSSRSRSNTSRSRLSISRLWSWAIASRRDVSCRREPCI